MGHKETCIKVSPIKSIFSWVDLLNMEWVAFPIQWKVDAQVGTGKANHTQLTWLGTCSASVSMVKPHSLQHPQVLPLAHDAHKFLV
jgi:hypothetical protein